MIKELVKTENGLFSHIYIKVERKDPTSKIKLS